MFIEKTMAFQAKLPKNCFSKSYGNETSKTVKLAPQHHIKIFDLVLNLSIISNKAPNLYSVISFVLNTVSITKTIPL